MTTCSICLTEWTQFGRHQVCCLPCGHLFGFACIEKWLAQGHGRGCPQCLQKATVKLVRLLHVEQTAEIRARDAAGEEQLRRDLESARNEKEYHAARAAALDVELGEVKRRVVDHETEVLRLRQRVEELEGQLLCARRESSTSGMDLDTPPSSVEDWRRKKRRTNDDDDDDDDDEVNTVIEENDDKEDENEKDHPNVEWAATDSTKDVRTLWSLGSTPERDFPSFRPGCGTWLRDRGLFVSTRNTLLTLELDSARVHETRSAWLTGTVKDVCFDGGTSNTGYGGTVAAVSLDGSLRLVGAANLNPLGSCELPPGEMLWSCAWGGINDPSSLYAGTAKGSIMRFDVRRLSSGCVSRHICGETIALLPIHSLARLENGVLAAASFNEIFTLPISPSLDEPLSRLTSGLLPRETGAQYVSAAAHDGDCLAIAVRGTRCFVQGGRVVVGRQGEAEGTSHSTFAFEPEYLRQDHTRTKSAARLAASADRVVYVDEAAPGTIKVFRPSRGEKGAISVRLHPPTRRGSELPAPPRPPLGAWFCNRPDACAVMKDEREMEFIRLY